MNQFFFQRVIRNKSFYFVLLVGLILASLQVKQDIIPLKNDLSLGNGVSFTPYIKWLEIEGVTSFANMYFLLLPILAALPFADTFAKDKQTGYILSILSRGKVNKYFKNLYIINFMVAGILLVIPLLVNIYLAFMFLPNVIPDPLINYNMELNKMNTLFPSLYYTHPFVHMLLYVFLAFIFAGMYATFCLSTSFFVTNRFIILAIGFLVQMILSLVFQFFNQYGWSPSVFLVELGFGDISIYAIILIFSIGMIISTLMYIVGVRRRVIT